MGNHKGLCSLDFLTEALASGTDVKPNIAEVPQDAIVINVGPECTELHPVVEERFMVHLMKHNDESEVETLFTSLGE